MQIVLDFFVRLFQVNFNLRKLIEDITQDITHFRENQFNCEITS